MTISIFRIGFSGNLVARDDKDKYMFDVRHDSYDGIAA